MSNHFNDHLTGGATVDAGGDDALSPAAGAVSQLVEEELRAIRAQADQARLILTDAITKLGNSFSTMQTDTSSQHAIMADLLGSLAESKPGEAGTDTALERISIRQFIVETTDVLRQFTDLLASVSAQSMRTVYRIDDMARQMDNVFKLVASINEISQETFILAVNATIEAAHAGQAGRTFAVIASNVRDLSQRTKKFNAEIGTHIGKAQSTINEVRHIVAEMASRDLNVALNGKERVQAMLPNLEAFQCSVTAGVDSASAAGERIAAATSTAITALQFEDIMSQLIGSIVKHADRIGELPLLAGSGTSDDGGSSTLTAQNSYAGVGEPVSDPVHQHNMNPGDVELF